MHKIITAKYIHLFNAINICCFFASLFFFQKKIQYVLKSLHTTSALFKSRWVSGVKQPDKIIPKKPSLYFQSNKILSNNKTGWSVCYQPTKLKLKANILKGRPNIGGSHRSFILLRSKQTKNKKKIILIKSL